MVKPRLLILSDLFGGGNPEWIKYYTEIVEPKFDIQYYDVLKLGEIDTSDFDEKKIHKQFIETGIDKAVENLLNLEKGKVTVLGFSIGGTIAWKASLKGLNVLRLIAVSSTRLRFETEVPSCKIKLYFGENDRNVPNEDWFENHSINFEILKNKEHNFYTEKEFTNSIFIKF